MAGFNSIPVPNFANAALGGYEAGRAMGQQRRRDDALATYAKDPDAGIAALGGVDPALSEQLRKNRDNARLRDAYTKVYQPQAATPALGGPVAPMGGDMAPPSPMMPQAPVAPAQPAPMAGGLPVNMDALRQLASMGLEGAKGAQAIMGLVQAGDEQRVKAFAKHAEMRGQLAGYLKTLPMEQRAAAYEAALPELQARGFIPQAVQGMRFDDGMLDRDIAFAVPTVQALTQARQAKQDEAAASERAERLRIAREGLGIRREALEITRNRAGGAGGNTANFGAMDDAALLAIAMGQR